MGKQIVVILHVKDLNEFTKFYESLGFVKNLKIFNNKASWVAWSDQIIIKLLKEDFYSQFIIEKQIADA